MNQFRESKYPKSNTSYLLLVLFCFLIFSCKSETINIKPSKGSDHKLLGKGVWVKLPAEYTKANNYDGYQAPKYSSSVSVQIEPVSSKKVRQSFDARELRKKQIVLEEFTEVNYADRDSAFYVVVFDKRKNTYRHLLSIKDYNQTINVKGFYFKNQKTYYSDVVKKALLSTYIDTEQESRKEDFLMADIESLGTFIFTKDGKFPTESLDQAIYKTGNFQALGTIDDEIKLKNMLKEITGEDNIQIEKVDIENGKNYTARSFGSDLYAFGALLFDEEKNGIYALCYGNKQENFIDCKKYFNKTNIQTKLK